MHSSLSKYFHKEKYIIELSNKLLEQDKSNIGNYSSIKLESNSKNRMQVSRLHKKLDNILFQISDSHFSSSRFQKKVITIDKEISIIKLLTDTGNHTIAYKKCFNVLQRAEKIYYTEAEHQILIILLEGYGVLNYNEKVFETLQSKQISCLNKLQKLYKVRNLFIDTRRFTYRKNYVLLYENLFLQYESLVNSILVSFDCFKSVRYAFFILSEYYVTKGNFDSAIKLCNEVKLKSSKKFHFWHKLRIQIDLKLIRIYFITGDYKNLKLLFSYKIDEDLKLNDTSSYNKYILYKIIYLFRTKEYNRADILLNKVRNDNKYNNWQTAIKELFELCSMYNCIINSTTNNRSFYSSINRIINLEKDKSGYNFQLKSLSFIYLLKQNKYSKTYKAAHNLQQYSYRHLNNKLSRERKFVNNLISIPKYSFDYVRISSELPKVFNQEQDSSSRSHISIKEIIPFENLWEITLQILFDNLPEYQQKRILKNRAKEAGDVSRSPA